MVKLCFVSLLLSTALFGSQTCASIGDIAPVRDPNCPTVTFSINGSDFSSIFSVAAIPETTEYSITADSTNVGGTGFNVSVNGTTDPDPVIDFGMSFDPPAFTVVFLEITTPYFGNFSQFTDNIASQLTDGANVTGCLPTPTEVNAGSCPGSFIEEFSINGTPVDFKNPGDPGNFTGGEFPSSGNLTLDVGFNITGGGIALTGNAGFVPEPGTVGTMGAGALALAAAVWRRRRTRA
jgi:hypothetical protein